MPEPRMVPTFGFVIDMPTPLIESARFLRKHGQAVKESVRATLKLHQLKRLPQHFKATNRNRYQHHERNPLYKARKRRRHGSITDLVKSGRTRNRMTASINTIRVAGTTESVVVGKLELPFPFPASREMRPQSVTPEKMAKEIERWTEQEQTDASAEFQKFYTDEINKVLAESPRWKKKIGVK